MGYSVRTSPYEQWQREVINVHNALSPLAKVLMEVVQGHSLTRLEIWLAGTQMFDCRNTLQGLNQTQIACPAVDKQMLMKYLENIS
ncbi:hypothetical protein DXZ20_00770 [Leptolyngbyaceae cyanobacterium CCMR0081]|uniref:Uncharacterized protein n=1 Tax=Adonisia turfae CCMR0081 TaxID=2292702 RepID=A0A6M0RD71_9CYAN|nr:hypothetical protein [Adonisia turfae CCMR0081]